MNLKTHLMLTATPMERLAGRFMKAPDHPTDGGGAPAADSQDSGASASEGPTTEEQLAQEFPDPEDNGEAEPVEASGADDDDDDYDEDDDEDGDSVDESASEEDDNDDQKPKKNRAKERIDELTAEARFQEREAQKWREEAIKRGADPDLNSAIEVPEEPDASKYEYGQHDSDYIRDKAKYDTRMEILEEQAKATFKSQAAQLDAKWAKNQAAALSRYPDFDEVVVKGGKEEKWHCPPVIAVAVKDSDYGPDVAYHLASNPQEAERIAKLTPLEQAREFGRLEERQAAKAARQARRAERGQQPNRVTKAPPPPTRRTKGTSSKRSANFDTDNFAEFERLVDERKMIRTS
jgi:hypothetical protein